MVVYLIVEMNMVKCAACELITINGSVPEFSSRRAIENHFASAEDNYHVEHHRRCTLDRLAAASDSESDSSQPAAAATEQDVIDCWVDGSDEEGLYLPEVGISGVDAATGMKRADLVVIPDSLENFGLSRFGVSPPETDGSLAVFPDQPTISPEQFSQLLDRMGRQRIEIQVYEAKVSLIPHAIGQVLFYSRFLPGEAPPGVEVIVDHMGIIYAEGDPSVEQFASECGISLHPVTPSSAES
jgi:CTP:molybdopterin cytidylyltransferase MocA